MRKLFGALAATCVLLIALQPTLWDRRWTDAWEALAPNLLAEAIGITVAVVVAEVLIRAHRARKGADELAPLVMTITGHAARLDMMIVEKLGYTPNEFKQIHREYLEGKLDPVHIPGTFKDRILIACQDIEVADVERAVASLTEADEHIGRYAALLEPVHVMVINRALRISRRLLSNISEEPRDKARLAEAFLDYHDALSDIFGAFGLHKTLRRIRNRD